MPHVNSLHTEAAMSASYNPPLVEQNLCDLYYPSQFTFKDNQKNQSAEEVSNIEQDYIDLFSYKRKGHMAKYVHMYRPDTYDKLLNEDAYYPFRMECNLLAQKVDQITRSLENITEVVEIGPGSYRPMMFKSIPFLRALEHVSLFSTYKAMDSTLEYAEQACQIIKKQFNTVRTEAIEIDFLSERVFQGINNKINTDKKKVLFGFGQPIFANNSNEDIDKILNGIALLLREGDYLIFSIDGNKDEGMLNSAYNAKIPYELLLNTMYFLKYKLNLKYFNPESFDFIYKWNPEKSTVELSLRPNVKQIIKINDQKITLNINQEFNIINSRKMDLSQIKKFLNKENLVIKDCVSLKNRKKNDFSIAIVQKK